MVLLGTIQPWEEFKLKGDTCVVILQPLCSVGNPRCGSALCVNQSTQLAVDLPRRTKVGRA